MISATQKNHCRITEQFGGTLNRYATPSCYATVAPIRSDLRYPRRIGLQQSTKPTAPLMPIRSDATPTLHGGEPLCTQTENNNRYAVVKLHYEQYVAYTPNLLRSDRGRNWERNRIPRPHRHASNPRQTDAWHDATTILH